MDLMASLFDQIPRGRACPRLAQQRLDDGEQLGFATDLGHQQRGERSAIAGVQPDERRGPPLAARLDVPDALQTQKVL